MTSCHECGSDVAETDVFCPFCGISLKPVALEDENSDFESTIVMQPSGAAKPVAADPTSDPGSGAAQETAPTTEPSTRLEEKNEVRDYTDTPSRDKRWQNSAA